MFEVLVWAVPEKRIVVYQTKSSGMYTANNSNFLAPSLQTDFVFVIVTTGWQAACPSVKARACLSCLHAKALARSCYTATARVKTTDCFDHTDDLPFVITIN